jgi:hypothetical protein
MIVLIQCPDKVITPTGIIVLLDARALTLWTKQRVLIEVIRSWKSLAQLSGRRSRKTVCGMARSG